MKRIFWVFNLTTFLFCGILFQVVIAILYSHITIQYKYILLFDAICLYVLGCLTIKTCQFYDNLFKINYLLRPYKGIIIHEYKEIDCIQYNYIIKGPNKLTIETKNNCVYTIHISTVLYEYKLKTLFSIMRNLEVHYIIKSGRLIHDENPPSLEFLKQENERLLEIKKAKLKNERKKLIKESKLKIKKH